MTDYTEFRVSIASLDDEDEPSEIERFFNDEIEYEDLSPHGQALVDLAARRTEAHSRGTNDGS
jgi:hypothetical protein